MSVKKSEKEWKEELDPLAFKVLRKKGTERPFSSDLHNIKRQGKFICKGCGKELFDSKDKFDSGTGWPAFNNAKMPNIDLKDDYSFFMHRIEILCKNCQGHLGHVFHDNSQKTGKYYCVNGAALEFKEKKKN